MEKEKYLFFFFLFPLPFCCEHTYTEPKHRLPCRKGHLGERLGERWVMAERGMVLRCLCLSLSPMTFSEVLPACCGVCMQLMGHSQSKVTVLPLVRSTRSCRGFPSNIPLAFCRMCIFAIFAALFMWPFLYICQVTYFLTMLSTTKSYKTITNRCLII